MNFKIHALHADNMGVLTTDDNIYKTDVLGKFWGTRQSYPFNQNFNFSVTVLYE